MRIAFVSDDLYPGFGGQARASEGHIEALAALGHDVRVLAGAERLPTRPPPGVRVRRLPVWRPGPILTHFAWPVRREILALLSWADVIQVNNPTPLGVVVCRLAREAGVPVVMGVHTQIENTSFHFGPVRPLAGLVMRQWYRWIYDLPTCLTAPTSFAAAWARSVTARPVHVVSNGIRLRPAGAGPGLSGGGSRSVVYVGRLSPEKRPQDLVEVARHLPPDVTVRVAGGGPMARRLARSVRAHGLGGRVELLGYVTDERKAELLASADVFLMPSPTELQSLATLEAMELGCAVVAGDYPSSAVPGVVTEARAGALYPPRDARAAARAVLDLLDDRERLATCRRNAVAYARSHDVMRSASQLASLYEELVPAGAAGGKRRRARGPVPRRVDPVGHGVGH